jgi:hypothetical protein
MRAIFTPVTTLAAPDELIEYKSPVVYKEWTLTASGRKGRR